MQRICSFTDVLFDALGLCAPVGRMDFYGFFLYMHPARNGKSIILYNESVTLLPLQGECIHVVITQGVALGYALLGLQPVSTVQFEFFSTV